MPLCAPSSPVVTHAVDLLTAAGFRVHQMQGPQRIDRDEYEVTIAELAGRSERREGDVVIITGNHEDHGRVTLRRDAGVFTIETEELGFVREAFAPMEMAD